MWKMFLCFEKQIPGASEGTLEKIISRENPSPLLPWVASSLCFCTSLFLFWPYLCRFHFVLKSTGAVVPTLGGRLKSPQSDAWREELLHRLCGRGLELPCTICHFPLPGGRLPTEQSGHSPTTPGHRAQPLSSLPPTLQIQKDKTGASSRQAPRHVLTGPDAVSSLCRTCSTFRREDRISTRATEAPD